MDDSDDDEHDEEDPQKGKSNKKCEATTNQKRCCFKPRKRSHICICCCSWCSIIFGVLIALFGILLICAQEPVSVEAEKRVEEQLKKSKKTYPVPDLEDLYGFWLIDNKLHPSSSVELKKENEVKEKDESDRHDLYKKGSCGCCKDDKATIVGVIQMYITDAKMRDGKPWYIRNSFVHDDEYKLILHKNGLVKFMPTPGAPSLHALLMARTDSKSWWDWLKNIVHGYNQGCFCFAVMYKEDDGTFIIERSNRWATKMDPFYKMTKQGQCEQ